MPAINAGQTSMPNASVAAAAKTSTVAAAKAKQRHRLATINASGTMMPSCGL